MKTHPVTPGLDPTAMPNWREGLLCRGCSLNSRMRASIHLLLWALAPGQRSRIYVTEQVTALYRWVKLRFPEAVGSEYLRDGTQPGSSSRYAIRHEDLTALSFADESFDAVISLEVIEHIPDFRAAFSECGRVLKPGGKFLLSVPFHRGPDHVLRARVKNDGTIEHLLPAEYHGDPLDPLGCLCFHHFGWDVMDSLKASGFRQAAAYSIWSPRWVTWPPKATSSSSSPRNNDMASIVLKLRGPFGLSRDPAPKNNVNYSWRDSRTVPLTFLVCRTAMSPHHTQSQWDSKTGVNCYKRGAKSSKSGQHATYAKNGATPYPLSNCGRVFIIHAYSYK